jgi:gamma-glutamyltranspeptidase
MFRDIPRKGIQDRPAEALDLPISLGMVGRQKDFFDPELMESCEEELRRELRAVSRQDMTHWTVRENPVVTKGLRYRICGCTPKSNGPRELSKTISHHQQKAVPMIGFG